MTRALLAFEHHWTCALLRAELLERRHVAACLTPLGAVLLSSSPVALDVPLIFVAEQDALGPSDGCSLQWLRAVGAGRAAVLVTRADAAVRDGVWDRVLRRPISLADIADAIDALASQDGPRLGPHSTCSPWLELRVGSPWPMIRCSRCRSSRHCEEPTSNEATGDVRVALVTFALAHEHAAGAAVSNPLACFGRTRA